MGSLFNAKDARHSKTTVWRGISTKETLFRAKLNCCMFPLFDFFSLILLDQKIPRYEFEEFLRSSGSLQPVLGYSLHWRSVNIFQHGDRLLFAGEIGDLSSSPWEHRREKRRLLCRSEAVRVRFPIDFNCCFQIDCDCCFPID